MGEVSTIFGRGVGVGFGVGCGFGIGWGFGGGPIGFAGLGAGKRCLCQQGVAVVLDSVSGGELGLDSEANMSTLKRPFREASLRTKAGWGKPRTPSALPSRISSRVKNLRHPLQRRRCCVLPGGRRAFVEIAARSRFVACAVSSQAAVITRSSVPRAYSPPEGSSYAEEKFVLVNF
ncbi:hypothetical protein CYMTET_47096 [Cymbomonas tetramitiformis]|uniref:Uncharacterized protein n=1 Tax=Cymbomonas tetramitiformis TaxID=36881 RepID=A0AAE0BWA8_9CHLO|nr:hypothetical protein CYMTET_47096 [Cymbomonas tetramitiformis]